MRYLRGWFRCFMYFTTAAYSTTKLKRSLNKQNAGQTALNDECYNFTVWWYNQLGWWHIFQWRRLKMLLTRVTSAWVSTVNSLQRGWEFQVCYLKLIHKFKKLSHVRISSEMTWHHFPINCYCETLTYALILMQTVEPGVSLFTGKMFHTCFKTLKYS